jgi:hypothetical protein
MDTLGDADELAYDEAPAGPRRPFWPWLTAESLSVAAITCAAASFLGSTALQYVMFFFQLSFGQESRSFKQYGVIVAGSGGLALIGLALGILALRRAGPGTPRWVGGLAGGAVILALVMAVLIMGGAALLSTMDQPASHPIVD